MPSSVGGSCDVAVLTSELGIMPASLSQVDPSVLQELPQELRVDLIEQLPAHRRSDLASSAFSDPLTEIPGESIVMRDENLSRSNDLAYNNNLWIGDPPWWVEEFKAGKCMILNSLAEMYDKSESRGNLSGILRSTVMECQHSLDSSSNCWIQAVDSFSELLRQYVTLKIDSDIEEIYVCFRLLRRFTTKSKFFLQGYSDVYPYLQDAFWSTTRLEIFLHFVCGARVLVKPYREKPKLAERKYQERMEPADHDSPHFSDMEPEFHSMSRWCNNSRRLRKKLLEAQELALELERSRLAQLHFTRKPVANQALFHLMDGRMVSEDNFNVPPAECFDFLLDVINNGSTSDNKPKKTGTTYTDQDSRGLDLPDSPFATSIVSAVI